ncbi:hypothetical protein CRG98_030657 [Punica granatum]|uniref:Uncharacterized protein n=2 Tax=Punica granatum TaxID=22663 RepID=A0A2I0IY73_PUNGR|nr:hypothetical protein CRG98_030657 [Punica granatum]
MSREYSHATTRVRAQFEAARVGARQPVAYNINKNLGITDLNPLFNAKQEARYIGRRHKRQLGGLQDIPAEADRLPFRIQWANSTSTAPARFLQIREIRRQRDASIIQRLYFLEHPTDEERVFSATSAYVARFHAWGLAPPQRSQAAATPRATSTLAPETESSIQAAMHAELRAIREERDRLCCELVDSRAEVADYRELQMELTRARTRVAHLDREMARLSAELDRVHKRARNLAHP